MQETWVWSLGGEDPLEEGTATHSSILAWRISWTEEPGRLQSIGSQTEVTEHIPMSLPLHPISPGSRGEQRDSSFAGSCSRNSIAIFIYPGSIWQVSSQEVWLRSGKWEWEAPLSGLPVQHSYLPQKQACAGCQPSRRHCQRSRESLT